jgi:GTP-binding protein
MAFIDEVQLELKAGDGGDGVVRWNHEKFKPKAGPGGGDGGNGGNVYAEVIDDLSYLEYYRFTKKFSAENGEPGGNRSKEGACGDDLILKFPRGTTLVNTETGDTFDLDTVGQRVLLLKGGRGGLGNEHFKSSTNTTPYEWTPGTIGEHATYNVELKLFADVGFVGLPSAGKSTLLNLLTNARSKVGAYHFTTLEPHLGALGEYVLADIPGLIKGASSGKGLGYKFLRHIARTNIIVHVIGLDHEEPHEAYREIRSELEEYGNGLADKKEIILFTKTDLHSQDELEQIYASFKKAIPQKEFYSLSAYDQTSIDAFKTVLLNILNNES